jgi:hypothetical protein
MRKFPHGKARKTPKAIMGNPYYKERSTIFISETKIGPKRFARKISITRK